MKKTKICRECNQEYPVEMFIRNRRCEDGYSNTCLSCFRKKRQVRGFADGLEFPQFTYITDLEKPRTLIESYMDAERRRRALHSTTKTC